MKLSLSSITLYLLGTALALPTLTPPEVAFPQNSQLDTRDAGLFGGPNLLWSQSIATDPLQGTVYTIQIAVVGTIGVTGALRDIFSHGGGGVMKQVATSVGVHMKRVIRTAQWRQASAQAWIGATMTALYHPNGSVGTKILVQTTNPNEVAQLVSDAASYFITNGHTCPAQQVNNLGQALGNNIWTKRDEIKRDASGVKRDLVHDQECAHPTDLRQYFTKNVPQIPNTLADSC